MRPCATVATRLRRRLRPRGADGELVGVLPRLASRIGDAASCGLSLAEYERRHASAKARLVAARDEAANQRAVDHCKGVIRSLQAAAVRTRALGEIRSNAAMATSTVRGGPPVTSTTASNGKSTT